MSHPAECCYAVPHCVEGHAKYAGRTSGRRPWDRASRQVWPGLWRRHQPLDKLDQRRYCCSQLLLSIEAICHQHSQAPRDFTTSGCVTLPQRHPEEQFNLRSRPAK